MIEMEARLQYKPVIFSLWETPWDDYSEQCKEIYFKTTDSPRLTIAIGPHC